jgi:hypothetical protein
MFIEFCQNNNRIFFIYLSMTIFIFISRFEALEPLAELEKIDYLSNTIKQLKESHHR